MSTGWIILGIIAVGVAFVVAEAVYLDRRAAHKNKQGH